MHLAYPFRFDGQGRTAATDYEAHVRDLVFQPGGETLASATQLAVQGALQQWLGDLIHVEAVRAEASDSTLTVTVQYVVRRTGQRMVGDFKAAV